MIIKRINNDILNSDCPEIVTYKYVLETNNAEQFDLSEFSSRKITTYSELLTDSDTNKVEGIIRITETNSPPNVFISTDEKPVDLSGIKQFEIDSFEIPNVWISDTIISAIFYWLQNHFRIYFQDETIILWFYYGGEYYMCPISHKVKEKEYKHFYTYMKNIFMELFKHTKENSTT